METLEFVIPKELKELKRGGIYAVRLKRRETHEVSRSIQRYLHNISEKLDIEFVLLPYQVELIDAPAEKDSIEVLEPRELTEGCKEKEEE